MVGWEQANNVGGWLLASPASGCRKHLLDTVAEQLWEEPSTLHCKSLSSTSPLGAALQHVLSSLCKEGCATASKSIAHGKIFVSAKSYD